LIMLWPAIRIGKKDVCKKDVLTNVELEVLKNTC